MTQITLRCSPFHLILWLRWRFMFVLPVSSISVIHSTQDTFTKVWVLAVREEREIIHPCSYESTLRLAKGMQACLKVRLVQVTLVCPANPKGCESACLQYLYTYSTGSSSSAFFRIQLLSFSREVFFLLSSSALVLAANKQNRNIYSHSGAHVLYI